MHRRSARLRLSSTLDAPILTLLFMISGRGDLFLLKISKINEQILPFGCL